MKIILLLILIIVTGCGKKEESKIVEEKVKEEIVEPIIEEYIDNNPIKIGLYIFQNNSRILANTYTTTWVPYTDINGFTAYGSNSETISNQRLQTVWKELWSKYSNIENYKIGYHIKFSTESNEYSQTILKPSDATSIYNYLQVYLYDDIHQDATWYSHIEEKDINENTILTTIKLTSSTKIDEITSDIELTTFTYDEDDFDENGNYRGISKFTTIIKRK